jgi:TonB-linked SusC/RagA family outer membrane protein
MSGAATGTSSGAGWYNGTTKEQWYDYGTYPGAVNRPAGASPGRNVVYETLLNQNLYLRNLISARSFVDVKFLKDFTFTPSISIDIRNNSSYAYQNPTVGDGAGSGGTSTNTSENTKSYTFNQILSYAKTIKEHSINVLVGHENYDYTYRTFNAYRTAVIVPNNFELDNFVTSNSSGGSSDRDRLESYFSKLSYSYNDKYFLDGSLRRDGSGRFSTTNDVRWGTFFSVGAGWSINKEAFLSKVNWVDDLRLKVSYGQVGNNFIGYYPYQSLYNLGFNNNSEAGALLAQLGNADLKWETQNTFNAGISFSLFNKRIYGELEVYKKSVDNLLFALPRPQSDPLTTYNSNVGSMYNQGVELQLGGDVVRARNFNWGLLTNTTILKNRITKLPPETPVIVSGTKRREVGKDYYNFYLRQYAGVDPSDGSALYIPADGTAAANIRTVNGVQYVTNQSFAKQDYSGTAIPDFSGSFTNTFSYKSLSLSVLFTYQIGGKFYDSQYAGLMSTGSYGSSYAKDILGSWTPANPTSNIPRADFGANTNTNTASTRWLIDASYIQLRNINLAYSLPKKYLGKIDVSSVKIFATGENLFLSSKRKGLDPSESFDGTNSTTYTQSRLFSLGINISL